MNLFLAFLKLIRWKNLLIVLITQWFVWCCVISPIEVWSDVQLTINKFHFIILTVSTLLIAAAGYVINDYFDVKIDIINRPEKVVIDKIIKRRWAMFWHSLFNFTGIALAVYLAFKAGIWWLPLLQLLSSVLLVFYSTKWKREYIIGNFIVSILTGLTVLIVGLYEPVVYKFINFQFFIQTAYSLIVNPFWVIVMYAYFAFMLTWMREVVKDMEDLKGDAEEKCTTMPIKIGLKKSIQFVQWLSILALIPLVLSSIKLLLSTWYWLGIYLIIALIIPMLLWSIKLSRSTAQIHFAKTSRNIKLLMIAGIFSLMVYYFLQFKP